MFRRLTALCAQEEAYAQRFIQLGADPSDVTVTGTMKFDTAQIADRIEGAEALASELGLKPGGADLALRVYRAGGRGAGS